jgi:hypothetical protein
MKNITSAELEKYKNTKKFQSEGNGIFKDLENKRFVITLRFELEDGEDTQYPLGDILDKYYVNCTDHIEEDDDNGTTYLEVEIEDGNDDDFSSLDTIKKIADLVGKRVYNRKSDSGGIALVIE